MIKDLRFHGTIGPIEYFTIVGGANIYNTNFYEETSSSIRFFSKGNEFSMNETGIHYKGTGGSFCEYMFGVEKPFKDLIKKNVANRLIMFGAFLDSKEKIIFTNDTEGMESYYRLFLHGHAVNNFYFFISSDYKGEPKKRQRQILASVGKFLKRTELVSEDKDTELLEGFLTELKEENSTVFIFKLMHIANKEFYKFFKEFYLKNKSLDSSQELFLEDIISRYGIDRYQQERMKIDIMYKHPDNKRVVDEYRDILIDIISSDKTNHSEFARLRRLRTLGIRNNIPVILFETLDEMLLKGKKLQELEEPEYLKETRSILQSLFIKDPELKSQMINTEDIIKLIKAKKIAYLQGDKSFEQILLDTVKACDEAARENNDFSFFEEFTSIVTYFDRFDNVYTLLSQIAFMEDVEFNEDSLRRLINYKKEFDRLNVNLFYDVFIKELLDNKYITNYGRKKLNIILKGIKKISSGDASLKDIVFEIKELTNEEKIYRLVHSTLEERMRSFYPGFDTKKGRERIYEEISKEFEEKGISGEITKRLFDKVLIDLKKESFYVNNLLPIIIKNKDISLREDFINNSGLDRFHIENLEKEYIEKRKLDPHILDSLLIGGGERI